MKTCLIIMLIMLMMFTMGCKTVAPSNIAPDADRFYRIHDTIEGWKCKRHLFHVV